MLEETLGAARTEAAGLEQRLAEQQALSEQMTDVTARLTENQAQQAAGEAQIAQGWAQLQLAGSDSGQDVPRAPTPRGRRRLVGEISALLQTSAERDDRLVERQQAWAEMERLVFSERPPRAAAGEWHSKEERCYVQEELEELMMIAADKAKLIVDRHNGMYHVLEGSEQQKADQRIQQLRDELRVAEVRMAREERRARELEDELAEEQIVRRVISGKEGLDESSGREAELSKSKKVRDRLMREAMEPLSPTKASKRRSELPDIPEVFM